MAQKDVNAVDEAAEQKYIDELVEKVSQAQKKFAEYSQEQVDYIFRRVALKMSSLRIPLAKMAVEETGMGVVEDKVIKNHFAAEYIYNKFKNTKTCGIIEEDKDNGLIKMAEPLGVIAGVVPTTNPTSTAIFKTLIALKTRNGIIFSPHPRAKKCTVETARIMLEEAVKAGAPENIIGAASHSGSMRYFLLAFGYGPHKIPNTAVFHLVYDDSWHLSEIFGNTEKGPDAAASGPFLFVYRQRNMPLISAIRWM